VGVTTTASRPSSASEAPTRFRQKGGAVSLISNAPRGRAGRPHARPQVPRSAYDAIVTPRRDARDGETGGEPVYLIGPERDHTIFTGPMRRSAPRIRRNT
jgi:hypothetical protein